MKNHEKEFLRSRRDFLRQASCASLGVTGLVNALAQMRLMTAAMAQAPQETRYKALVFLFLNGGNDSNNMLVPAGDPASSEARADYQTGRGVIAIPRAELIPISVSPTSRAFNLHYGGTSQPLGFHPNMPELAGLFNTGKLSAVANVGSLAYPVGSRVAYNSGTIPLPSQLFSHSDQQTQWQSSVPDRPFSSGWGGRAAELLNASYNSPQSSKVSMNISLAGVNSYQVGTNGSVVQYVVQPSGTVNVSGYGTNYTSALNTNGTYKTDDTGKRFKAFEDVMRLTQDNLHEEEQNRIIRRARATEGVIGAAQVAAATAETSMGFNFNTIFTNANANHRLGDQLKMIAKLIAGREMLGNKRQVYFCQVTGYDTHSSTLSSHANLMTELSTGMKAFHDVLQAMGTWNDVLTCTASDFNRTFTPNGTVQATAGCDHGWGGHTLIMGGDVKGGDVFGHFPLLRIGNAPLSLDAGGGSTNRGRWVPTTSVDQYCAVMTKWLGADSSSLEAIFPNLPRFDDPFAIQSANINYIKPALV
jgi:uncharacterized protein (DUF1501 family)